MADGLSSSGTSMPRRRLLAAVHAVVDAENKLEGMQLTTVAVVTIEVTISVDVDVKVMGGPSDGSRLPSSLWTGALLLIWAAY